MLRARCTPRQARRPPPPSPPRCVAIVQRRSVSTNRVTPLPHPSRPPAPPRLRRFSTATKGGGKRPPIEDKPPAKPSANPPIITKTHKKLIPEKVETYWESARQRVNWDSIAATTSWILFGTTTWLVLGTTTVVGLILFVMNLLEQQDYYAEKLGHYLSASAGYRINFGGRITSSLWEAKIRLRDVTIENMVAPQPGEALIRLHVEELAVRLSLEHWLQGRGLLTALEAQGITGKIDANAGGVVPPNAPPSAARRRTPMRGDLDLLHIEIRDADVSVYGDIPYGFKSPLDVKLFFARASRLRRQYLLLDVLQADHVVGELNGALFLLRTTIPDLDDPKQSPARVIKATGLPIALLQSGGASGPLAWLTRGRFDLSATLQVAERPPPPPDRDPYHFADPASPAPAHDEFAAHAAVGEEELRVKCSLLLSNLAASVPLTTPHISYLASIGVRPVAAYLNANYTQIPLELHWAQPVSVYEGAWYPGDARLIECISQAAGTELASLVTSHRERRRIRSLLLLGIDGVRRGAIHAWHYATSYFWQLTPL